MSAPDYDTVKVIKDGHVEYKDVSEFPSARRERLAEYMREYMLRRRANNGGPLTIEERETKVYLSEMPHMGGGS